MILQTASSCIILQKPHRNAVNWRSSEAAHCSASGARMWIALQHKEHTLFTVLTAYMQRRDMLLSVLHPSWTVERANNPQNIYVGTIICFKSEAHLLYILYWNRAFTHRAHALRSWHLIWKHCSYICKGRWSWSISVYNLQCWSNNSGC